MNKKELAAMDELRLERDMARALSWPGPRPKSATWAQLEQVVKLGGNETAVIHGQKKPVAVGWGFNEHRGLGSAVTKTAFDGMYQCRDFEDYKPGMGGWSQTGYGHRREPSSESGIFLTRLDALKALAWAKAMAFAKDQAAIIALIDKEP